MKKYKAIGLMSGTSLDGLDIAACEFVVVNNDWSYNIPFYHTYPYTPEWKAKLAGLQKSNALDFSTVNVEYGHFLGRMTRSFIELTGFKPDVIASHGHTIFHQPEQGLTVQVGSGAAIAAETGIPVICDFRSLDVALGGQGAPLVPVGDRLLFKDFDGCLNLGGFANISMESEGKRIAFDICPVNIVLNELISSIGQDFDKDGQLARSGTLIPLLLEQLNAIPFYHKPPPKSLGREWLENLFLPLIQSFNDPLNNILSTIIEHVAIQVNLAASIANPQKILVTGGGVHNGYLMERIKLPGTIQYIELSPEISDFKEALVFAFLGILRWRGEKNIYNSVTGSSHDHSGGAIFLPA
jgi:anhydro-N-acetylmuramic acid kinase